jgi:3-dehydroquinate synthase
VFTDEVVSRIHLDTLVQPMTEMGIEVNTKIISSGEQSKTLGTAANLYDFLVGHNVSRTDTILAFGGGVVGDLAGFIASTFKRGLNLVHVPTTLLAQVDSSVGGKTGVNLQQGKNLVGTFYQPNAVIVDVALLRTLPDTEFHSGLAEVIKYGMIMDRTLLDILTLEKEEINQRKSGVLNRIVERALRNKAKIVECDEREEAGEREILNFGHTVGHSIETSSLHKILHGQAVAIGMAEEARYAESIGLVDSQIVQRLVLLLESYGLPTSIPDDICVTNLRDTILQDKKMRQNSMIIPILVGLGKTTMRKINASETQNLIPKLESDVKC